MGAGAFDGRVRDGIGSGCSAWATRPAKLNTCLPRPWRALRSAVRKRGVLCVGDGAAVCAAVRLCEPKFACAN